MSVSMYSWLIAAECVAIWTSAQQTHIFVIPMHFCTNTGGQYYCTCKDGYEGNGKICNDRNECKSGEETCSSKNGFYEGLSF